ncbi:FG-GAP repeat domain-containing protein [Paenibacillus naphthalenovorans]|uniref:FG-GAP repeat domain-containing protein n=1 Tax=Paenibacillus naphthalenovorans TaxID=162209 RepID=UPI003D2CB9B4
MTLNRIHRRSAVVALLGLLAVILALVLFMPDKELKVRMLYATQGDAYDTAAYGHLRQTLVVGLELDRLSLDKLSTRQLQSYDTIMLDPALHGTLTDPQRKLLVDYVEAGGHLFLENPFADDFEPAFLGAKEIVDVKVPERSALPVSAGASLWSYPDTDTNLQGVQQLLRSFADTFFRHDTEGSLSRFSWGKGIIPSTAETLVSMNGASLYTVNRYGRGTVFFCGTLLPNRYYITGYDLTGGMDPKLGFEQLAAETNAAKKERPGALYFDRSQLPLEPYFHFTFAAGSHLLRSEYAAFISKVKLGYSVKKTLGPYGRPAMAYQNHFEAMEAIRDGEGIQWAELLRKYNQIPSFSLVRSAFTWGRWQESVVVHLNTGTNEKPAFAGETPNSFYSSGNRLMGEEGPIRLAAYPEYRSLGDPITLPYRAVPALADVDGDGNVDLVVGSADGSVYVYPGTGAAGDAYAGQQLPEGMKAPAAFGKRAPVRLENGEPLKVGSYASVAAADLNADGRPDLLIGRPDGTLAAAYGRAGGVFTAPAALLAGGQPVRAAAPLAAAVGDVTGDGVPDLVVGDGDGRVTLYRGERGAGGALAFAAGAVQFKLPAPFAAPSIRDMDGDGRADLVVGGLEGDLRVYLQRGSEPGAITWLDHGVMEAASTNQLGSRALVGGHSSVPFWYDLNADGRDDLIVGQLEFGMPSTIDDPKFPYADQLNEFIQYSKKHHLELYPHIFVHNFTSDAQEKQEIALHRQAFDKLGIPWGLTGTNQHTWRINHPDRTQTLRNEREAGIWFNFGFKPSYAKNDPRLGVEYNWGLPFLMTNAAGEPELKQPMMLYTPAPVLRTDPQYSTKDLFEAYAAMDLPIDYFEHIEYHFPVRVPELLEFVRYLDGLRNDYSYNFMTETQMARSFLNAMTTRVKLERPWREVIADRLKKMLGMQVEPGFRVKPDTGEVPEHAAEYTGTLGLAVELGQPYADKQAVTDADVHDTREGKLYFGAPQTTNVRFVTKERASALEAELHLLRSNVPYELEKSGERRMLKLNAPGMQQIRLRSTQPLTISGPELKVDRDETGMIYTVTHFGDPVAIEISYGR